MLKLPADKHDLACARAIARSDWQEVQALMPQLFRWTQDPNWPVATVLYPYFIKNVAHIVEDIREVLKGEDLYWQGYLLDHLIEYLPLPQIGLFAPELQQIAQASADEGNRYQANELLKRWSPPFG
jgi:hypothetical protein